MIDQVKNRSGLIPYPADMPVHPTDTWGLTVEFDTERSFETSAKGKGPVGPNPVAVSLDVATEFKKTVKNHSQFEKIETKIIQPTDTYQKKTLNDPDVQKLIKRMRAKHLGLNTWSLYMISGIAVAVGASGSREEILENEASGEGSAEVAETAGGSARAAFREKKKAKVSYKEASDFVWAVRLHKISKNLFASDTTDETYTKGATFARSKKAENIPLEAGVEELNSENSKLIYAEKEDVYLVIQEDETVSVPYWFIYCFLVLIPLIFFCRTKVSCFWF
ncbi:hypothetical protein V500_04125 [Pseudogymnoascus sp. VKM F-4518 (FW-2643)]|nr:hypothetical protein V500_04125 [Pseudogymnoascus sp. VKM F-4518 (FW-2643)]